MEKFKSLKTVSKELDINYSVLYSWISNKNVPSKKIGWLREKLGIGENENPIDEILKYLGKKHYGHK